MRASFAGLVAVLASLLVFALPGCLFVAGAAVATGAIVVTGEDSVEATLEKPFDRVYNASIEEVKRRGTITVQSKEFGNIEGDVVVPSDSHVVVKIERIGEKTLKLVVSARKLAGTVPDRSTSETIGNSIVQAVSK